MRNLVHRVKAYLLYLIKAGNAHGLHSPFVFRLFNDVCHSESWFYAFDELESERQSLIENQQEIEQKDFGSFGKGETKKTTISNLARSSLMPPHYAQILFRLVNFLQPEQIVELGTSFGLTTAYLGKAHGSNILSFEGATSLVHLAKDLLDRNQVNHVELVEGAIDDTLPAYLQKLEFVDLAVLDANHTYEATLRYVNWILPKLKPGSCLIVDDIYWSPGMTMAWDELRARPEFNVTIDIFRMGLLFYKRDQLKEHFVLYT